MKFVAMVSASLSLVFLASCSGGSSVGSNNIVPPVQASSYSNASVMGMYSAMFLGPGEGAQCNWFVFSRWKRPYHCGSHNLQRHWLHMHRNVHRNLQRTEQCDWNCFPDVCRPVLRHFQLLVNRQLHHCRLVVGGDAFFAQPIRSANQSNEFRIAASKQ